MLSPEPTIRSAVQADGDALASIYNWYIENTTVSFEEKFELLTSTLHLNGGYRHHV